MAHAIDDNELYRGCIRRRQQLVTRQYNGRCCGYQHAAQQRFWEWWLDRFEQVQWWLGTADRYLRLSRDNLREPSNDERIDNRKQSC